jgi:hypothetical protein
MSIWVWSYIYIYIYIYLYRSIYIYTYMSLICRVCITSLKRTCASTVCVWRLQGTHCRIINIHKLYEGQVNARIFVWTSWDTYRKILIIFPKPSQELHNNWCEPSLIPHKHSRCNAWILTSPSHNIPTIFTCTVVKLHRILLKHSHNLHRHAYEGSQNPPKTFTCLPLWTFTSNSCEHSRESRLRTFTESSRNLPRTFPRLPNMLMWIFSRCSQYLPQIFPERSHEPSQDPGSCELSRKILGRSRSPSGTPRF